MANIITAFKGMLNRRGEPIKKAELLAEQAPATTRGVRQPYGDHPASGLTPGRLAAILRDSIQGNPMQYLELAQDMEERHEHYQSVLSTRKLQVSGLEITVEAASDSAKDVEIADMVRDFIERAEFQDELIDILDAMGKGFSCTEIRWATSARQWWPEQLIYKQPTWFTFDRTDGETILLRTDEGDKPLEPAHWIVHRAKAKSGLTIRGGLARMAAWSFFFKSFTAKDWAIFVEAYGQPLRVGKYGSGASDEDKETLLRAVTNVGADYAAIIPDGMVIDFIKADLSGTHDLYEKRSEYLDRQVSKLVLGQVGTVDAVAGGFSGNKVHNEVRADIEKDDARKLSSTINRDLVTPFVMFNHGPQKKYPIVTIGRPDEEDVSALVTNVAKLVPLGLKVSMSTMRDKIGVPDPAPEEELLSPPVVATAPPKDETPAKPAPKPVTTIAASAHLTNRAPDAIDLAIDDILENEGWDPLVAPIINGLQQQIARATSEEEVKDILRQYARTMDVSALTDKLANALFAARLAGEADQELD